MTSIKAERAYLLFCTTPPPVSHNSFSQDTLPQQSLFTTPNASSSQTLSTLSPTPHPLLNHLQQVSLNENPKLGRLYKSRALPTRSSGRPRTLGVPAWAGRLPLYP